jgi:DNA processing protein
MSKFDSILRERAISPWIEMAAYEALWAHSTASFKRISEMFRDRPNTVPSDLVTLDEINALMPSLEASIKKAKIRDLGIRVHGTAEYPSRLRDAAHPLEFFYYRGWWDLVNAQKSIAIVGTRNPSIEGVKRARKLVKLLVEDDYTIVSGLAKGIDTVAHKTAIECNGKTIAVIGTPITKSYPPENADLQEYIAENFLLISQVPMWRYSKQSYMGNKLFFPERNATMSALTDATVIVEAGETSGTLTQARAALYQGRKLFILDSCFENPSLTWPKRLQEKGAIRVRDYEDIKFALAPQTGDIQ